ncbi:hypothetical protein Q5424_00090 [Conexibacter sp. JD483]|uniref:hypothetical protein n=1 Tax=unclassified Conexibacter TaxID=2627773 RepID=UPI0027172C35|nr:MULTISPECIES: hypothetical protein [unclassified Conexibacter]MDO8184234.1 hypothetical protein [Conexibacter sp. CPCC 205706]MDR9367459.1 hypothetical protein [Conexibacter sp. JD483]
MLVARRSPFSVFLSLCAIVALALSLTTVPAGAASTGKSAVSAKQAAAKKKAAKKQALACAAAVKKGKPSAKCARYRRPTKPSKPATPPKPPTTTTPTTPPTTTTPTTPPTTTTPTTPPVTTTPTTPPVTTTPTTPPTTTTPTTPPPATETPTTPADPATAGKAKGWNGFGVNSWPGANWRPYADSSPFNRTIGNAAVHSNSAGIVSEVLSWGLPGNIIAGSSGSTLDYAHPTYYAQPTDPIYTLKASGTKNYLEGMRIRIPTEAKPALGDDGHMTVVQPDGWEYDFWRVQDKPAGGGTLTFSIGGRTRIDGDGIDSKATASNFGNLAGVIRAQELAAGKINHALFIVVRCTSSTSGFGHNTTPAPSSSQGAWVFPASHGGARCSAADEAGAPPMGARFQLNMTATQINALSVPAWKKTILTALATYGGYVGDTGGSGFAFQFESGSTYTSFGSSDPLVSFSQSVGIKTGTGSWAGTYAYNMSSGVDWAKYLRVTVPPSPVAGGAKAKKPAKKGGNTKVSAKKVGAKQR